MRVSVAMTTFNGAAHLEAQLDSLAAQTLLPSELVVVDDASSDGTPEMLARFAARAPFPVRIHRNPVNIGWRENFFRALEQSEGELVAFCDQDDIWLPEKLATCVAPFADPEVLLVYHGAEVVDADGRRTGDLGHYQSQPEPVAPPLSLGPWKNVLGLTMVFRGELRRYSRYWPASLDRGALGTRDPHDQWIVFLASTLGKVAYVDRELVRYRQHGGNAVGLSSKGGVAARVRAIVPEPVVRPFTAHRQLTKLIDAIAARTDILRAMKADAPALADRIDPALAAYAALDEQARLRRQIYDAGGALRWMGAARTARRRLRDAQGAWRIPESPGAWSDILVRGASGLFPPLRAQLMGASSVRRPAE